MSRLRAAIVGAGLMGRWHAHAVQRAGARIAAVVDLDSGRAAALARRHGARHAATLAEVLDLADVVHVCTPTASHAALVAEALGAGRHVLVEKPLAGSAADTRTLFDLSRAHGVLLCPVHQFPFQAGIHDLVAALPHLAPVRHVDFTMCSAGASRPGSADADAIVLEILPHPLSLLARLVPSAVSSPWLTRRTAAGEYRLLTTADGVSVSVLISMAGRPTVNALRLIADHGTANVNLFHGYAVIEGGAVSRGRKVMQPFTLALATALKAATNLAQRAVRREPAYPGLAELTAGFYSAAASGATAPISPEETVAIADSIDAISPRAGALAL